ncbi:MAG: hypothetical protein A2015_09765 [Spirochaetes bacterium GWF1_31_7]|nr:MAG: hypothetical protein A2Y30_04410 [Spirochaetes bacterium GWE1_32_154]OHD47572.1 MAG: hypothetical protein A2015_09765 [Spirochaetes bacterium GWF1_31_7]OHD52061.1 MAG: hypothetical protein A2Y29_17525 [Spirochaetes bacterium GWE2_31_10]OHD73972.1 MAG: hypothetical protein A2355_12365 [Spirochaetes bacterium RIFOXYB1_FULL_32_8]HBD93483.1 hypothetical protein [Spirochaetia bacterium]
MNTDPTDDIYKRYVLLENENTNLKNEYAVLQSELIKTNATLEIYKQRLFCKKSERFTDDDETPSLFNEAEFEAENPQAEEP